MPADTGETHIGCSMDTNRMQHGHKMDAAEMQNGHNQDTNHTKDGCRCTVRLFLSSTVYLIICLLPWSCEGCLLKSNLNQ